MKERLSESVNRGLAYWKGGNDFELARNAVNVVEKLVSFLPPDDLLVAEAQARLAGDHSKWPGRRLRDLIYHLASHTAELHGLTVEHPIAGKPRVQEAGSTPSGH